jgi:hypothetical protein
LWTLLEQNHAALNHGGRAVLIDDFIEELDLSGARRAFAVTFGERVATHMQLIAGSDRPLPSDLFDAGLF